MTITIAPGAPPSTPRSIFGDDLEVLPPRGNPLSRLLRETTLLVGRGLRALPQVPERLADVTIQPVIFTLLFVYVFGSAIDIPGIRYQDFLLPGLIGQNVAFGVMGAGVATATDFSSGVVDRFRSLPIHPLSVINAQVVGQLVEQILGMAIVAGLGFAVGWRPDLSLLGALGLIGLLLFGMFAFTWFGVLIGMMARNPDGVQGIGFAIVLPLSFLAGTFVPIEGMATIPRIIGEWNPLSPFVAAVRQLCTGARSTGSWQLEHAIPVAIAWCAVITAVCVPLALRRYRKIGG